MVNSLEVVIWDVEHGTAILVNTPTGKRLVIDLGVGSFTNSNKTFSPLKYLHDSYKVKKLDALVITHPHGDHIDDIFNLNLVPPGAIYAPRSVDRGLVRDNNKRKDAAKTERYFQWLDYAPVNPTKTLGALTDWGCTISLFHTKYSESNLNNYSLVTVIGHAGSTILIPGDNEPPSWKLLLDQSAFVSAIKNTNLFVTSHHGRESGYHADLFTHFKPQLCFLSDTNDIPTSATNRYTYQALGAPVFNKGMNRTETRKTVTTRSDHCIVIKCYTEWDGLANQNKNLFSVRIN
jgi:beta-lactamase superfamily II metal-dependent hydrolase